MAADRLDAHSHSAFSLYGARARVHKVIGHKCSGWTGTCPCGLLFAHRGWNIAYLDLVNHIRNTHV